MATALCRGVVAAGLLGPEEIVASDPDEERRAAFAGATSAATTADNPDVCRSEIVVLAVKPQVMPAVLAEIAPVLTADTLVVSIAAGIPTAQIEAAAATPVRVIRAMPNTPMLVGEGASALCKGAHATHEDLAAVRRLFESCSLVLEVEEHLIHAVTALSGSGPAYLFYLAEMMARAGAEMGLSEADAGELTHKTLLGAARMLVETGEPAGELRRKVTSPGGTTEAAIASMERDAVADAVVRAIQAACARSRELGTGK
jgi:pyrroline-5-carboxylate reductase